MITLKKEGFANVFELLPSVFTVIITGILLIFFVNQVRYIDIYNQLNNLARNTILKMESERGLTSESEIKLMDAICAYSVSDVSLEGTTRYNPYLKLGDDVILCMSCSVIIPGLNMNGIFHLNFPSVERKIQIQRSSVILY